MVICYYPGGSVKRLLSGLLFMLAYSCFFQVVKIDLFDIYRNNDVRDIVLVFFGYCLSRKKERLDDDETAL